MGIKKTESLETEKGCLFWTASLNLSKKILILPLFAASIIEMPLTEIAIQKINLL